MANRHSLLLFSVVLLLSLTLVYCTKKGSNAPVFPVDCAHQVAGVYNGSDYCTSTGQSTYSSTIIARDSINISFNYLSGVMVTAILDCNGNTITIPTQSFPGNFSISGTGTYTRNRIIVNWNGLSYGVPVNCSSTLTR